MKGRNALITPALSSNAFSTLTLRFNILLGNWCIDCRCHRDSVKSSHGFWRLRHVKDLHCVFISGLIVPMSWLAMDQQQIRIRR